MKRPLRSEIAWGSDTDTLSHWVKQAFLTMRREMDASLRASGLTVTQWRALGTLLHAKAAAHSDLVRTLEIEAPSVTSLVNGMERKGWVKRARSSADARVKQLSLTPQGRRVIEHAAQAMAPVEARMAATLSAGERSTLRRLLRTMVEGMR
jgi:DNA-binding MarR family transcriptional regulator